MSYASDHIFGFPIKQDEEEPKHYSNNYPRGSIGWCERMVYVFEKRCKVLEKENLKLKNELEKLKSNS